MDRNKIRANNYHFSESSRGPHGNPSRAPFGPRTPVWNRWITGRLPDKTFSRHLIRHYLVRACKKIDVESIVILVTGPAAWTVSPLSTQRIYLSNVHGEVHKSSSKIFSRLKFDRIMVMSLWPHFFGPPCSISIPVHGVIIILQCHCWHHHTNMEGVPSWPCDCDELTDELSVWRFDHVAKWLAA